MQRVASLVEEYKAYLVSLLDSSESSILQTNVEWDCTSGPEKGRDNWIEVSARPAWTMQLFVSFLINILMGHLSNGNSLLQIMRQEIRNLNRLTIQE